MKNLLKETLVILVAAFILGLTVSYPQKDIILFSFISFLIIILINIIVKKAVAYHLEANAEIGFWQWYRYGFKKGSHFKKPIPMAWLPLVITFITQGAVWWLAILKTDITPRTERVSKKHGLYRFSKMTEWHIAVLITFGIVINLIAAVIGYIAGFESFSRLNIYFAFWSLIPVSELDGSKLLFGSKALWFAMFIITTIFMIWGIIII